MIIHSDLLLDYLKSHYPNLYFVSSTTKVLTDFADFLNEVKMMISVCCTGLPIEQGI